MSGILTVPFRKRMLAHVFRGDDLGFTEFELALTRRVPSTNASPVQLDEPVGGGYRRITIPVGPTHWAITISGEMGNSEVIHWPYACTVAWGQMNGWALLSIEDNPIVCAVGQLVTPYRVVPGILPYLPATGLAVGLYD